MKFFRLKYIVLALLFQVFFSTALSAVQLVNEGFDTSSSVDSWTKSSNAYWTQYSGNGYLFLDKYDSAYKTYNFGAAYAYQPLSVSVYWCATSAWESRNDYLRVRINDTSDYTDYDGGGCQTYSFTADADSSGDFKIEFSPQTNKNDEDAYIDWFTIDGTPLAPPVVNDTTYSASIFSTIGTTIGTLSASNNPTSFQITGGDSSVFAIDNSGVITTKTLLDHNTSTVYSLTVEASNAQGSDTATVTINLVDPSPVLSDANFTVETNAPIGTVVGTVPSTNSPTSFSILSGDTTKFSINNSGVISTVGAMETNTSIVYTLDINGSNADGYDTATITIDLSHPMPTVNDITLSASRYAPTGTFIGTLSSSNVDTFTITSGDTSKFFIDSSGSIWTSGSLDYDTSSYTLDINGSNPYGSDTATVTITIDDSATLNNDFTDFAKRISFFAQGSMVSIGNTFTVAPYNNDWQANCDTYTNGAYYDPITSNNLNRKYCHYNVDGVQGYAATTAELVIPHGAEIKWAGLYWQALTPHRTTSYDSLSFGIRREEDNSSTYTTLNAQSVNYKSSYSPSYSMYPVGSSGTDPDITGDLYSAFRDLTTLFKTNNWSDGNYTIRSSDVMEGRESNFGVYAAWNLIVIYKDTTDSYKSFTVFDGWKSVSFYSSNVNIPISGFYTPKTTPINARIAVFAGEGDYNINGDKLKALRQSDNTLVEFLNSNNPGHTNQTFSSFVNTTGTRVPSQQNNNGIDVQTMDIGTGTTYDLLQTEQTDMDFYFTSTGDLYFPSVIAFSTEIYTPSLCYDYSLKQDGRYLDIDRNTDHIARVNTRISDSPIDVTIYLRNKEADISADDISIRTDLNATLFNQTGNVYSSNTNGSILVDRGAPSFTSPLQSYALSDTTLEDNGYTDAHNIRKGLSSLGSQNYIYTKFTLSPQGFSGLNDVNESLGLTIDYSININSSIITYEDYELGGTNVPICPPSGAYVPTFGQFNIVQTGSTVNNLTTQISRNPFDVDVIFDSDPSTGTNDAPTTNIDTTVLVEVIDVDAFGDLNASCANPDSVISSSQVFVPLSYTSSNWQAQVPSQNADFFNFAVKNATYRVWYFVDNNDSLIENWTATTTNNGTTLQSISGLYDSSVHTACTAECSDDTSTDCFTCIRANYAHPLCARDNFSVRPESFDLRIYDINQTLPTYDIDADPTNIKNTTKTDVSTYHNQIPTKALALGTPLDLVANYNYRYDINATGYDTLSAIPGYTREFDGASTHNITMYWNGPSATFCNDDSNRTMSFYIVNGKVMNQEESHNNVGDYYVNIIDTTWTAVDWDPSLMTHHTTGSGGFASGTDCLTSSTTTSSSPYGCTISSDLASAASGIYRNIPISFHPYMFDITNSLTVGKENKTTAEKSFVYMNNIASSDENMSVHLNTFVTARGYSTTASLTNYTSGCYSKDTNFQIGKSATTSPDIAFRYLSHDINGSGTRIPGQDITGVVAAGDVNASPIMTVPNNFWDKNMSGVLHLETNLNFDRNSSLGINPENINFTTLKTDDNITIFSADLANNKTAEGNITVNQNVWYYYGKTQAPKISVTCNSKPCRSGVHSSNDNNQRELIYFTVYCNPTTIACNPGTNLPINAQQIGDARWWQNTYHDVNVTGGTDGDIGTITEGTATGNTSEVSRSQVNTYTDESVIEYNGPFPYDAEMLMQSSPWLIYDEDNVSAVQNSFIIQFVGNGGWSGKFEEDSTTKTSVAPTTNRRIMW